MRKVLEGIRGVVGVSGVILWNKQRNSFEKILPAKITDSTALQLCTLFSTYCSANELSDRAIVRFKKGWVVFFNQPRFAIMVLGKSDLAKATLKLVLRSTASLLEVSLKHDMLLAGAGDKMTPEHGAALARAVNLSLSFFQGKLSRADLAEMLRQSKGQLVGDFPVLKVFGVDNNGGLILLKGAEKNIDATTPRACARLLSAFLDLARERVNAAGFDLEKQTAELQPLLSELRFYLSFREIKIAR